MPFPNPKFEPPTHRWRLGAVAPSREVPSQICASFGQKQPFFAQKSARTHSQRPNKGTRLLHSTYGLTSRCQRDLWCAVTPRYIGETPQKDAKKPQNLHRLAGHSRKPKTGRISGCVAQNAIPRTPSPPATPHLLWFPPLKTA